ncbi:hypothetical protein KI809_09980 [Geobacter pelophilus]|uniref:Carboxypeptidase regulatory-like domain-containing protein n=1 Tax=Geoanaerobacter pelophilus TaxID=60036 RepID=A0AAW4L8J5_9BACT|nr:hypothetical protein [Geoanaerobacter pelophilus]MBT0664626.1 hypothetical protein [Geoanaerobacter pelophilus]
MKFLSFKYLIPMALLIASLAGCGGGGGSPAGSTAISGTASAGIIYPGVVNVYAVNSNGVKGTLLKSTATDINGKYTLSLGDYSGAILVEVSGTYTDEATGNTVTIPTTNPLHALVDSVNSSTSNNRVVSVTPLTDLAWRKASSNGTSATPPAVIATANNLMDDLFKISDIIGIEPVRPDIASVGHSSTSQESQAYTLALAALSKMASTATGTTDYDKMNTILSRIETEIETDGAMSTTAAEFSAALGTALLSSDSTTRAADDFPSAATQLAAVGKKSQLLTLSITGTLPAGTKIHAIEGAITLPATVSLRAESTGKTLSDVLLLAGVATGMGSEPIANYLSLQVPKEVDFNVVLNTGIGTGDFAVLSYDVSTGATVTAADFSLVSGTVFVKDSNGADIPGLTLTIR